MPQIKTKDQRILMLDFGVVWTSHYDVKKSQPIHNQLPRVSYDIVCLLGNVTNKISCIFMIVWLLKCRWYLLTDNLWITKDQSFSKNVLRCSTVGKKKVWGTSYMFSSGWTISLRIHWCINIKSILSLKWI